MIIILNNKCNLDNNEFITYQKQLSNIKTSNTMVLCPSHVHLANFSLQFYYLGCQNVSESESGPHTGEVSAKQLKSFDVDYCIVGHSERRKEHQETLKSINTKIKNLLKVGITPILCIGETKEEREKNIEKQVLKEQLISAFEDLIDSEKEKIIIAYEPTWSIGTGLIPTKEEISDIFSFLRKELSTNKLLYGGSANETNIKELNECKLIDGYLLGGLSLKSEKLKIFIEKLEN